MAKLIFLVLALVGGFAHSSAEAALREIPVSYPSGDIELAALLLLPDGPGPYPAAVVVHGSGDSDRTNLWARAIAETVAEAGFAVLLTDKRGSGDSEGDWRTVGFHALAADALAGVAFLSSRADIDEARIGLVGLSQGGRIVPIAAAQSDAVAFVLNLVGDAVSFAEQSAHEMGNIARQAGLPEPMQQEVLRLNGAAGRALLTGNWDEYRRLREAALASPWARIAQGFPPADDPVWTFYREVIYFDPMPYWTLVRQPALILYGEEDEQDNVAVAESVRRLHFGFRQSGKANYEIVVLPGVGHSLGWTRSNGLGEHAKAAIQSWLGENVEAGR
ncbi:MAG: alpha/beta hydrolase family protein [Sphingosinicella sp.]|uniref:alpha/beta hydrolase family protein n=1 Tax=Sphingosinicella sp. TaxID=1917971 RepID=UPI0040384D7C